MNNPGIIEVLSLMPKLDAMLIDLLKSLSPEEWELQTVAPQWRVKDIAAHLLDGNLRTLSMLRDGYYAKSDADLSSHQNLIKYLNQLNGDWVQAMKRISPAILVALLQESGREYSNYISSLDLTAKAVFSVGWAGESESKNWFHIAREYTEKWHHQQQIRFAIGKDAELLEDIWYRPYLETSVRALPHHYRTIEAKTGDAIQFDIVGDVSLKTWYLQFQNEWKLVGELKSEPSTIVQIPDNIAWRIFTKGIGRQDALQQSKITGDRNLGEHVFSMIAIMG